MRWHPRLLEFIVRGLHIPVSERTPDALFPVASLSERRRAALLDGALLLFSYGGMLALFWALGGRIGFNKLDAVVTVVTLMLFYAQYFALFTVFGGSTPGMMLRGLRVVSFDGSVPTSRQMVWRSFGYLVSAGTCFLGFLWALWDEDHLCWQDRISQTYLTPIESLAVDEPPAAADAKRECPARESSHDDGFVKPISTRSNLCPSGVKRSESCAPGLHFLLQPPLWASGVITESGLDRFFNQILPRQVRVHKGYGDSAHTARGAIVDEFHGPHGTTSKEVESRALIGMRSLTL